jgi:hypothetical protein
MPQRYAISYSPAHMVAQDWRGWDDYHARLSRYEVYDGYYHNIAYLEIASYAETLKSIERLYKHVRGVFNPVSRIVELYTAKVFGGMLDTEAASTGAIIVNAADDRLRDSVTQLWRNSRWGQKKSLFVRNGAKFGDAFLKVTDDIRRGMVYIENVNPSMVADMRAEPNGKITYMRLEYWVPGNAQGASYQLYREEWTPETVTTFLDGKRAAVHTNGRGDRVDEWRNEYGFVPFVHVQHRDVGLDYGASPYYTQLHKINELNDIASNINDAARNQANMPLVFLNAKAPSPADYGSDNSTSANNRADSPKKDSKRVLELTDASPSSKAAVQTIPPTLSLTDSATIVNSILEELERDLPELSLHRLRDGGNLTAPGVRSAYDDAIARIEEARGNYQAGLIEAQKMGVAIGGMRNYRGFEGFSLTSMDALDHTIQARPVIGDTLSRSEKITVTLSAMQSNAPAVVFKEIGWDDDAVNELQAAGQQQTNLFMSTQMEPVTPDPDETPTDAARAVRDRRVNENTLIDAQQLLAAV